MVRPGQSAMHDGVGAPLPLWYAALVVQGQDVDVRPIGQLLDRIIHEFRPFEIRLFGSRARGEAEATSDWDLFVVVPDDLEAVDDLFAGYRLRRETRTRADVVLCPLNEF